MGPDVLAAEIDAAFRAAFAFAGPVLLSGAALGLVIAVLQAATQIQEQSLAQTLKIILVSALLLTVGPRLATSLVAETEHLFTDFPRLVP